MIRSSGTDKAMIALAKQNASAIAAGHSFILFLGEGFYPINVLNTLKHIPEICEIYCATANPVDVVIADNGKGRAVLGVFDGEKPKGFETEEDVVWRKDFLRKIGYKA